MPAIYLSIEEKKNAVKSCFERGESVKSVSKEPGCSSTSLYLWRDRYFRGGTVSLMKKRKYLTTINYAFHKGLSIALLLIYPAITGIIIIIFCFGKYYFSIERIYKSDLNITLPKIQRLLLNEQEESFTGDGSQVIIYLTDEKAGSTYNTAKEKKIEYAVKKTLSDLKVKYEWYPNFKEKYYWKMHVKNGGFDTVYILYFPQIRKVYVVRNSI
ncbi:transposase [Oribacterium sp. oral taxon 078]|uniref:transposase n=1 Tax=Oribacterium sp. oral taxon 078 TaxID=652706 RepID=UPI0012DC1324|nr:transposase [Oribacterium sp. oral taxon 078]